MSRTFFEGAVLVVGFAFAAAFSVIVIPALLETRDVLEAFAAGFVNPFSSGYSLDVILCAVILVFWMLYERSAFQIRHGWVVIPLSFAPGVATAFAVYLVMRSRQLEKVQKPQQSS